MEILVLVGLAFLALPLLGVVALARTSTQQTRIDELGRTVYRLGYEVAQLKEMLKEREREDAAARQEAAAEEDVADAPPEAEPAPTGPRLVVDEPEPAPHPSARDGAFAGARAAAEEPPTPEPEPRPEAAAPEPEREPGPEPAEPAAAAASAAPPVPDLDFETRLGSTWLLRIGLVVLAIALALFARTVAPLLPPAVKTALAYAGSLALFGVGKVFEEKLEKFARPVMAAGLSFGFFVAFAAHFVPAMRAVPMAVSLGWMAVSMLAVLVAAERWRSQATAGLAILLGHVSAFVAAGQADLYSLVVIAFLAVGAIVLLLRHDWLPLGLFALGASYGSHLLWILAERGPVPGDRGFWLNLAFLTSYYVIFVIADALWWHRRDLPDAPEMEPGELVGARAFGPANLVMYVSLTSFVFFVTGAHVSGIEWFFFTVGAFQAPLAVLHHRAHHEDFVFYPAFGVALLTLGLFASLDALVLNLVLSAEALLLLLVARRTGLWVFHALAQVALVVAFVHYLAYPPPAPYTTPLLIGGLGLVAVYLVKASLEEAWYGEAVLGGTSKPVGDEAGSVGAFADRFRDLFDPLAPRLAGFHAVLGGVVLIRETTLLAAVDARSAAVLLAAAQLVIVGAALAGRRTSLLLAYLTVAAGGTLLAIRATDPFVAHTILASAVGAALLLVHGGAVRLDAEPLRRAIAVASGAAWMALVGTLIIALGRGVDADLYPRWALLPVLVLAFQESAVRRRPPAGEEARKDPYGLSLCVAAALTLVAVIASALGPEATPPWSAAWAAGIVAAAALAKSRGLLAAGYAVLFLGYAFLLGWPGVAPAVLGPPWIAAAVVAVPLVMALGLDRESARRATSLDEGERRAATAVVYGSYAAAFLAMAGSAWFNLPLGWSLVVPAALALAVAAAAGPLRAPRALRAMVVGTLLLHLHFGRSAMLGADVASALPAITALLLATLALERLVARRAPEAAEQSEPIEPASGRPDEDLVEAARWTLVGAAAVSTLIAVHRSTFFGPEWATAGWSTLAVFLMAMGFGVRSAVHRRVALAIFALALVRVFAVDVRGLSDAARTGAFFVLGLALVGVAWLYARFATQVRSWL